MRGFVEMDPVDPRRDHLVGVEMEAAGTVRHLFEIIGMVAAAPMAKPQAVSAPAAEAPVVIEKRYGATTESKGAPSNRFGAVSAPATKPQGDSNPS